MDIGLIFILQNLLKNCPENHWVIWKWDLLSIMMCCMIFFYFLPSQSLGVVSKDVAVSILKCKDQVKRTLSSSLATVFPWSSSAAITSQPVSSWCLFFLSPRAVVAMEKVKTVTASELGCLETNELSLSLFPPSLVWIL